MTRRLTALALALVLALSLTGCWEAEPEPDDFWGDELPPEDQETSQREPAQISDFTLPYLSGQTFDPVTCIDGVQQTVGALLYEPLFTLDNSFAPQPVLCVYRRVFNNFFVDKTVLKYENNHESNYRCGYSLRGNDSRSVEQR